MCRDQESHVSDHAISVAIGFQASLSGYQRGLQLSVGYFQRFEDVFGDARIDAGQIHVTGRAQ
jgi:hypothetical protein